MRYEELTVYFNQFIMKYTNICSQHVFYNMSEQWAQTQFCKLVIGNQDIITRILQIELKFWNSS